MKYPKISIVTQCYNREDYIAETIESVLSQGYPNLEYIVIDDNSTDGSWEIIQKYKSQLSHCERLSGNRSNPATAVQYGLSLATGEIMTWLFSKNILLPKALFTVAQAFNDVPDMEWMTAIGCTIDSSGKIVAINPIRKDLYDHMIGGRENIQQESTFWRKSLWDRTQAKLEEDKIAIDVTLWSTKFFPATKLYHLNTVIGAWRKSNTSYSGNRRPQFYNDINNARERLLNLVPANKRFLAHVYKTLKYCKPILRNIPDKLYEKIPILTEFSNTSLKFENIGNTPPTISVYKRNPFRTIYPW